MYNDTKLEAEIAAIDLMGPEPSDEHSRELYYIGRLRTLIADRSAEAGRKLTACTVTFGCQMNARDSEKLIGILVASGFEPVETEEADFVIFNTCTVRDNADQRTFGRLGRISHLKKKNPYMKVAICGCMMQEKGNVDKVRKSYPFVDLIFGTHNIYRFAQYLWEVYSTDRKATHIWEKTARIVENLPIERKYPYKSGINIMFGCDNFCSYCIVPYVRGRERSRDPREILRETENLAADGVREIMLLGQNVNSYGKGLENPISFAELLNEVCKVDGIERVRFMTPHPKDLSYDLIRVIRDNPKAASASRARPRRTYRIRWTSLTASVSITPIPLSILRGAARPLPKCPTRYPQTSSKRALTRSSQPCRRAPGPGPQRLRDALWRDLWRK